MTKSFYIKEIEISDNQCPGIRRIPNNPCLKKVLVKIINTKMIRKKKIEFVLS